MPATGNIIVDGWTVLDLNEDPLTGMTSPADVELVMQRQSGSAMVAASEIVSWTEVGSTGRYYFSFTPENTGLYLLYLEELSASSLQRKFEFRYEVFAAGAVFSASYANAYCAETDIERWLQQAITATTAPSDTQAGAFAESRASVLSSLCNGWGFAVTPSTVVAGTRIEDMLREANAIGAALDYTLAQQFGRSPSKTARPDFLQDLWTQYVGDGKAGAPSRIVGYIEKEIRGSLVSLSTDHILSGDTLADPTAVTAPFSVPIGIGMRTDF